MNRDEPVQFYLFFFFRRKDLNYIALVFFFGSLTTVCYSV